MKLLAALIASFALLFAAPVAAQSYTVTVTEWVEEVEVGASRFVSPQLAQAQQVSIAAYGPFRVIDGRTAALVGITDHASPAQFARLLRDFPEIAVLNFVEMPGTHDDVANMAVGRMIRAAGIATRVPAGGSVRSGGVELFLGGARMEIAEGAEFAVHGWLDDRGRGAEDYPMSAPEHRRYLDYYAEMGMAATQARAFYAMTNSVPFEDALWLTGSEMADWLGLEASAEAPAVPPQLAYLDLGPMLP